MDAQLGGRTYFDTKKIETQLLEELEDLKSAKEKYMLDKTSFEKTLEKLNSQMNNSNEKLSALNMKIEIT